MKNTTQGTNAQGKRNQTMPVNNDQLGENASEEYKSDEYDNAIKSSTKPPASVPQK